MHFKSIIFNDNRYDIMKKNLFVCACVKRTQKVSTYNIKRKGGSRTITK